MEFQSQLKISFFTTAKTIYAFRYKERRKQSCAYEKNQALKILKRPFGYFCGSGQKLHAQQGGIKVGNTKRLNGT
ncbi:hypothetical protein B6N13_02875 [Marinomonas sp. UCMA 3892]|nr:hypothetical protein [Marinomonas sp. UCMA 3892]